MTGPLGVHPDNPSSPQRLSHLTQATPTQMPEPGGRPTDVNILQLEAVFDPINGEGTWTYWLYPQTATFDDYEKFKRQIRRYILKIEEDYMFEVLMDYLHNYQTVNVHLDTGQYYAVVPRPTGYVVKSL